MFRNSPEFGQTSVLAAPPELKEFLESPSPTFLTPKQCCLLAVILPSSRENPLGKTDWEREAYGVPGSKREDYKNKKAFNANLVNLREKLKTRKITLVNLLSSRNGGLYYLASEDGETISSILRDELARWIQVSRQKDEEKNAEKTFLLPDGQEINTLVGQERQLFPFLIEYFHSSSGEFDADEAAKKFYGEAVSHKTAREGLITLLSRMRVRLKEKSWTIKKLSPNSYSARYWFGRMSEAEIQDSLKTTKLFRPIKELIPPEVWTKIEIDYVLTVVTHYACGYLSTLDKNPLMILKNALPTDFDYKSLDFNNLSFFSVKEEEKMKKLQELKEWLEGNSRETQEKRRELREWVVDKFCLGPIEYYSCLPLWNISGECQSSLSLKEMYIISLLGKIEEEGIPPKKMLGDINKHFFDSSRNLV